MKQNLKVKDKVYYQGETWIIVKIWDTNCEGLRADLIKEDTIDKLKRVTCSAQIEDLERKD